MTTTFFPSTDLSDQFLERIAAGYPRNVLHWSDPLSWEREGDPVSPDPMEVEDAPPTLLPYRIDTTSMHAVLVPPPAPHVVVPDPVTLTTEQMASDPYRRLVQYLCTHPNVTFASGVPAHTRTEFYVTSLLRIFDSSRDNITAVSLSWLKTNPLHARVAELLYALHPSPELTILFDHARMVYSQGGDKDHRRVLRLYSRLKTFDVVEFGQMVDLSTPRALEALLFRTYQAIEGWDTRRFHAIATSWLDKRPYRPIMSELMAITCPSIKVCALNTLRLDRRATLHFPQGKSCRELIPVTYLAWIFFIFIGILQVPHLVAKKVAKGYKTITQAFDDTAAISASIRSIVDPIVTFVKSIGTMLLTMLEKAFGAFAKLKQFVAIIVAWLVSFWLPPEPAVANLVAPVIASTIGQDTPDLSPADLAEVVSSHSSQAGGALSSLMSFIFGVPFDRFSLPAFRTGSVALSWLFEKAHVVFMKVYSLAAGIPYPTTVFENEIVEKHEEAISLLAAYQRMTPHQIRHDTALSIRSSTLKSWHLDLLKNQFGLARLPQAWTHVLSSLQRTIDQITTAQARTVHSIPSNVEPVWLNIYGTPGAGKSHFLRHTLFPSVHAALRAEGYFNDDYSETAHVFAYNQGEEFWDGYARQPYMFVDDLLSTKIIEDRNKVATTFINLIAPTVRPLVVADMNQKNNLEFASLLVGSTTNDSSYDNLALVSPEAFTSRMTIYVEMIDRKTFKLKSGVYLQGKQKADTISIPQLVRLCVDAVKARIDTQSASSPIVEPSAAPYEYLGQRGFGIASKGLSVDIDPLAPTLHGSQGGSIFPREEWYDVPWSFKVWLWTHWPAVTGVLTAISTIASAITIFQLAKRYLATPPSQPERLLGSPDTCEEFPISPHQQGKKYDGYKQEERYRVLEGKLTGGKGFRYSGYESSGSAGYSSGYESQGLDKKSPEYARRITEMSRIVSTHIGCIQTNRHGRTTGCFMTAVGGHDWVVPAHMLEGATSARIGATPHDPTVTIDLTPDFFTTHNVRQITSGTNTLDAVLITFPELPFSSSLTHRLTDVIPKSPLLVRYFPTRVEDKSTIWVSVSSRTEYMHGSRYNLIAQETFNEDGMCGLPVFSLQTGDLIGIHVAGSPEKRESCFAAFTRHSFPTKYEAQGRTWDEIPFSPVPGYGPKETHFCGKVSGSWKTFIPTETKYRHVAESSRPPSPVAPAALAPFDTPSGRISPLRLAWNKYSVRKPVKEPIPIDVDHLFFPRTPRDVTFETISFEEATFGSDRISPIDFMTAVGPTLHAQGVKTRLEVLNPSTRTIDPAFRRRLETMWEAVACSSQHLIVADGLKDELRDVERVRAGKTRLFFVADLDYLILCRAAFGLIIMAMEEDPVRSVCSVGINPTSSQWEGLAGRLRLRDPARQIWTGDYSGFDTCISYAHVSSFAEFMARRSSNPTITRNLIMSLGRQYHISGENVYTTVGTNPSGVFFTSVLGSYVNALVHHEFFSEMNVPFEAAFYSDDSIVTFVPRPDGLPRISDFAEFLRNRHSLVYTSSDKSLDLKPTKLEDVVYLKRRFAFDHRVMAPLPKDTIHQMLDWTTGKTREAEIETFPSRASSALVEALQHDEAFYCEIVRRVLLRANSYGVNLPVEPRFDRARASLLMAHYY